MPRALLSVFVHMLGSFVWLCAGVQVPIALFQSVLASQGVEKDMDELECILANLIFLKYIKGYIAHKQKVVVVAKQAAYPPLRDVVLTGPL